MEVAKVQEHGGKAVQYIEWAVAELKSIGNVSLAEHLSSVGTMLTNNLEDLMYEQQAEEQEIYNEFG